MSTAAHAIDNVADSAHERREVVLDAQGMRLFQPRDHPWSRAPCRRLRRVAAGAAVAHIGIYGYRAELPARLPRMAQAPIERRRRWNSCAPSGTGTARPHVTETAPGGRRGYIEDLERDG